MVDRVALLPALALLVIPLARTGQAQTVLYSFPGTTTTEKFGSALDGAGDTNADGYPDFIVGSQGNDLFAEDAGAFYLYSGRDAALLHVVYGTTLSERMGTVVDGVGDTNGDGYADVVEGSTYARIYSGKDATVLHYLVTPSVDSVAGAGDVNQDGVPDVIVGAPISFGPGTVRVHSGFDGSAIHTWTGCAPGSSFGGAVDGAGDVNADGVPDLIVLVNDSGVPPCPARADVFDGDTGAILYSFTAGSSLNQWPLAVRGAGDVNADGYADVIVGNKVSASCSGSAPGEANVYSGKDGSLLHKFTGDPGCSKLGTSVSPAGDVDADGYADLLVGAMGTSAGTGYAEVYSGRYGNALYRMKGTGVEFGWATGAMGDLNQDGRLDFGVGEYIGTATIYSACSGTFTPYGDGCPGAGAITPKLWCWGCPMPGESVNLTISKSAPGGPAFLILGSTQASVPLAGTCSLDVSPILSVIPLGVLPGSGPGTGKATHTIAVPAGAAGAMATVQAFVFDASVPHLYAASNGVEVQIL